MVCESVHFISSVYSSPLTSPLHGIYLKRGNVAILSMNSGCKEAYKFHWKSSVTEHHIKACEVDMGEMYKMMQCIFKNQGLFLWQILKRCIFPCNEICAPCQISIIEQ